MSFKFSRTIRSTAALMLSVALSSATATDVAAESPRILTLGDSMMVWNFQHSIPRQLDRMTNAIVTNRAAIGAMILNGEIPAQFTGSNWNAVVMNGGGNDLLFGCGCLSCDQTIEELISEDLQSGAIVDMLQSISRLVPKIIYVGYLRSPGVGSPIEHCADEGAVLEARIEEFTRNNEGMDFVSLVGVVPDGDRSFHSFDMIHPSSHGSRVISMMILDSLVGAE